jgi:REP-associated tyrosine transposase
MRFFDRAGKMPAVVELELHRPAGFGELTRERADKLRGAIAAREAQLATARRKAGRSVLGRKAVLAQSAFDCPASHAPRRGMSPRVAAANKWRRIEALQRNRGFVEVYRDAWERLTAGARDVVFPLGTYKLALHGLVRCGVPPA